MKNMRFALVMLLAVLALAGQALGQELDGTLKKIKESSTFTLGYLTSAPPFSFPGPDKRPVGYSIDLCTHIASAIQKQLGINLKLNWVPVTTENRIEMVASGKVDIECSTTTDNAFTAGTGGFQSDDLRRRRRPVDQVRLEAWCRGRFSG